MAESRADRWLAVLLLLAGLAGLSVPSLFLSRPASEETKAEAKLSQKAAGTIKLSPKLAQLYGIKTETARGMTWQPRLALYGRVVPNPRASAELRAPFAGTARAAGSGWPGLGSAVAVDQSLAVLQARFSPQERLDLQSKATEAEEKLKGADEVLKVQEERVQRLGKVTGIVPRTELDLAQVAVAEARALRQGAQAQAQLWRQVLKALDDQPIAVTLSSPLAGEVVEIGAQPGTAVEAGALLLKVVDYGQVLVRLDVPVGHGMPPAELELLPPTDSETHTHVLAGRLCGPAPAVDAASQHAGYYYTATSPARAATWRPGLFVTTHVPDPSGRPAPAAIVPATAILYHQGRALAYVQIGPGRFERREVQVLGREGESIYVGRGVRAGEEVVSQQAQVLLSEEFRGDADDD
jgi:biotin carboxyl carrier protein